jgi:hypothetical protein
METDDVRKGEVSMDDRMKRFDEEFDPALSYANAMKRRFDAVTAMQALALLRDEPLDDPGVWEEFDDGDESDA